MHIMPLFLSAPVLQHLYKEVLSEESLLEYSRVFKVFKLELLGVLITGFLSEQVPIPSSVEDEMASSLDLELEVSSQFSSVSTSLSSNCLFK